MTPRSRASPDPKRWGRQLLLLHVRAAPALVAWTVGCGEPQRVVLGSLGVPTDAGACPAEAPYEPPLTIDDTNYGNGRFRGRWQSDEPGTPALTIHTTQPVLVYDSRLRGPGDLIRTQGAANLEIRDTYGTGVSPGLPLVARGNFVQAAGGIRRLVVEHCTLEATKFGVYVDGFSRTSPGPAITVRYNRVSDLNGRYQDSDLRDDIGVAREYAHFVQLNHVSHVPEMEVAWNEVTCAPRTCSMDAFIDINESGGTADSPLLIHDNFFRGGYASDPTSARYGGGGVSFNGASSDSPDTVSSFSTTYGNQIVNNSNFGVQIGSGHDHQAYGNRAVSTGKLADGRWMASVFGNGIIVWNGYAQPDSVYFNNRAYDNVSGWVRENAGTDPNVREPPSLRVDYYLPACAGGWGTPSSSCTGNVSLDDPLTEASEANETTIWQKKLVDASVTPGAPLCSP